MSTSHLERTSSQPRLPSLVPAVLESTKSECASGSIASFLFRPRPDSDSPDAQLSFQPGQWVDFHIRDRGFEDAVGGFSFISDNRLARDQFELAVKKSDNRPAVWLHEVARPGAEVAVRVGGSFVYDPDGETVEHDHVVFVAYLFFLLCARK
jgi:ferredoxin-NADP reductase